MSTDSRKIIRGLRAALSFDKPLGIDAHKPSRYTLSCILINIILIYSLVLFLLTLITATAGVEITVITTPLLASPRTPVLYSDCPFHEDSIVPLNGNTICPKVIYVWRSNKTALTQQLKKDHPVFTFTKKKV